jgi:hypothetical protein
MDILRHFNFEGAEESASATSSIPDTVSLNSDESPSDSELSHYEDYPRKPSSAARQLRGKQTQPSLQNSHSYFELSSAVLNTFDSFQSQCCGYDDVASMLVDFAIRPRERWSAFESKHSPDRVSVVVEVSGTVTSNTRCKPFRLTTSIFPPQIVTGSGHHVLGC